MRMVVNKIVVGVDNIVEFEDSLWAGSGEAGMGVVSFEGFVVLGVVVVGGK